MHTNTGVHIRTHNSLLNSIGHKTATPLCLKLPSIAASFAFTLLSHPAHTCSHPVTHTQVCPTVLRNAARHEAVAAHGKRDGWWWSMLVTIILFCFPIKILVHFSAFLDFHCLTVPIKILVCFPRFPCISLINCSCQNPCLFSCILVLHCLTVPIKNCVCFPCFSLFNSCLGVFLSVAVSHMGAFLPKLILYITVQKKLCLNTKSTKGPNSTW